MRNILLGPSLLADGRYQFCVWAPNVDSIELHLLRQARYLPMEAGQQGYYTAIVADIQPGDRYMYRLDGEKERPDPATRWQPEGVHGPSAVPDMVFDWQDAGWVNPTLQNTVFYELHTGTFTPEGTFDAMIPHLERLKQLGITTLELMPVAQFPGDRNWGYDGVNLYAPHTAYGGVNGLKQLVNAAHQQGMAVVLDVVYNHLGPEGNYLWDYGPYFTDRYVSPWGSSVNFDGAYSDEVRRYFINNAIYWLDEYHIDGLRLDATHALFDFSAVPFLEQLADDVHTWAERHNRRVHLIAENDASNRRLVLSREANGMGLDGQWLDDLHHAVHNALTGEQDGYYADYGNFRLLSKILREGFAYSGQYSPHRKRTHGTFSADIPTDRFIVCTQNHDQVGNRMLGERRSQLTDLAGLKLSAGILLLSPYVPLLFMGQEYGETAPFLFFTSYTDEALQAAVREGRKAEFAAFKWQGEPPDPGAEATFQRSKLNHDLRKSGHHRELYELYTQLLHLRRTIPALTSPRREDTQVISDDDKRVIWMMRGERVLVGFNFDLQNPHTTSTLNGKWRKRLYSGIADSLPSIIESGTSVTLEPKSFVVYERDDD